MTPTRLYLGQFDADGAEVTLCSGLARASIKSVMLCNGSYEYGIQFHLRIENPSDPTIEEGRFMFVTVPPIETVIENLDVGLPAGWNLKARALCADPTVDIGIMVGGLVA